MCEETASYLAKRLELYRVKKFKQNFSENYSKSTKSPLQHVNVQNFSGRACLRILLEHFLFLNQLQIISAEKKYTWKKVEIMPPSPF